MTHTMQLFDFIKFCFKNLMNLPNLQCNSHSRSLEEKNSQNSINQSIGLNYHDN